jgi:Na+/proline symporter
VLAVTLVGIVSYGLWRSRNTKTTGDYLLAGKTMPWYAMALSIMATQASAITFISTTGQSYADGMRFVQFYFGLPLAMIVISATVVPRFHNAGVYTAYEYLERRFDARVRTLISILFLLSRGLAVGIALYAPAVVLTVILGWPDQWTTWMMGSVVVAYTVLGGIKAVTWTDFQQMIIMTVGLFAALFMAVLLLPPHVTLSDAIHIAGAAGKINPVTLTLDFNDRYNLWSGLIGGMFLALAYFGCDQSQVQRYLTGSSIAQSRLSLLFNAVAKIPMQFFILFTGAMVFVFYIYERPPVLFHPEVNRKQVTAELNARFDAAFTARLDAAEALRQSPAQPAAVARFQSAQKQLDAVRKDAAQGTNDTNYIFLSFVTRYLPAGLVGLVLAAIFSAAMSTISGEVNSLATVSVIDIYKRLWRPDAPDAHYLRVSQLATLFWGIYAVLTANFGRNLGSLVEAVNMLGSLFYPGLLGVFVLAFYFPRIGASAAFWGVLFGEAVIFAAFKYSNLGFLWFNVLGCLTVLAAAHLIQRFRPASGA